MNTKSLCRRAALIERAAEQRRQLVYALSQLSSSLRPLDHGIGWISKHRPIALGVVALLGFGVAARKLKLLLAFALTVFRLRRMVRAITGPLRRGNP